MARCKAVGPHNLVAPRSITEPEPSRRRTHDRQEILPTPKAGLFFAALHTFMFLVPQIFMTSSAVDMVWGEGKAPEIAEFYEYQLGVLGLATPPFWWPLPSTPPASSARSSPLWWA